VAVQLHEDEEVGVLKVGDEEVEDAVVQRGEGGLEEAVHVGC
jgi:electron transfer flavoprotein alpha/beta subunit